MGAELRQRFIQDVSRIQSEGQALRVVTVAVQLPSFAIETITNTMGTQEKVNYYMEAYDDNFKLKNNPAIEIVGYMLV